MSGRMCKVPECTGAYFAFDLCEPCYQKARARHRNKRPVHAKLSYDVVDEARREFWAGISNISELAEKHGVSHSAMSRAVHGKTWRHVPMHV